MTFTMKVARLSESLTVTGESPLVDTRSTQVSGNIDRRQMEELPIQGRNWMELSMMVKGVTSNDISNSRPGVGRDDQFQLNLDGQQITQQVAWANLFGQPRLSRESIAEYQVVTNMFDITMGRSVGLQVQAISRSGTNIPSGSVYGYFRDSKFNAKDFVVKQVVPCANQQIGGAIGGPLIKDKMHFFANYERENEPNTIISKPPALGRTDGNVRHEDGAAEFPRPDRLSSERARSSGFPRHLLELQQRVRRGARDRLSDVGRTPRARFQHPDRQLVARGQLEHDPGGQGRVLSLPLDARARGRCSQPAHL